MKSSSAIYLFSLLLIFSLQLIAQDEDKSQETNWDVPELFSFHDVIYPIWHTAFPNKDIEMLKNYVDEVNLGAQNIYKVQLPGILRDKETKWNEGVEKLRYSVDQYNKAAQENDTKAMLNAAENLHSSFEMLVRIIKPMSKEIDDFHQTLYLIYHYYYPEKSFNKLKEAAVALYEKIKAVKSAEVPKGVSNRKNEYLLLIEDLYESTNELKLSMENNELAKLDNLVEDVHTKYQLIEQLFE